jgi:hypothetical protein
MAQGTRFDMEKEFAGLDFHSVRLLYQSHGDSDTTAGQIDLGSK